MIERPLGDLMVVRPHIAHQRCLQLCCRCKARLMEYLGDPAVEALDHTVGLRVTGWAQTMLNAQRFASHIELVNWLPLSVSSWTMFMGAACSRRFRKSTQLSSL